MKSPQEVNAASGTETASVLVVDADAKMLDLVRKAADSAAQVRLAASVDAAQVAMTRTPADVVLVNLQIADHAGTELIRTIKQKYPKSQIIALSRSRRSEECVDAFRAGAADMLLAPFSQADVQKALTASAGRRAEAEKQRQRHERLRLVCRRLNKARHEISQQVDLLCNDLVRAYQEMAQQLNLTQTAADFAQALAGELDVEGVLRRTMEWILRKLGPLNAAIYLPSGEGNFSLGAYLNLDTQADGPLIDAIGRTIVAQARGPSALVVEDDKSIDELFGDDGQQLHGRQWLAVGCLTPRECLGVLVVFRSRTAGMTGTTELSASARGLIEASAPILAERIEQALGLYHRLHPFHEDQPEDE